MFAEPWDSFQREFAVTARNFNEATGYDERRALLSSMRLLIIEVMQLIDESEMRLAEMKIRFLRARN